MRIVFSLLGGLLLLATTAFATGTPVPPGYTLDPSLSAKSHSSPTAAKESHSPLRLQADDKSASLHLLTEIPFSPYLGASREADPGEEETPSGDSNPQSQDSPSLEDYHLEAGFACPLNDSTRLNVGYRFAEPLPNMMDQVPTALQEQADDLHISLDFKLPF